MDAFVHQVKGMKLVTSFGFPAAELKLPPGAWVVFAKADLTNVSPLALPMAIECRLVVGGAEDKIFNALSFSDRMVHRETVALNLGVNLAEEGAVRLLCFSGIDNTIAISNITISAMGVDLVNTSEEPAEPDTYAAAHNDFWRRQRQDY